MAEKKEFEYKIEKHIGIISENPNTGWKKEINLISYNGKKAKYDIRDWTLDNSRMGKGVTLDEDDINMLMVLLNKEIGGE